MIIDRKELLDAAETVKPALATKELLEELVHIWSDGKTLTAYNDGLGIQVPFKSDLIGGIRGSVLLGVLANSRAKEIEINVVEQEAEIKAGRTRLKLALLGADRTPWQFPELSKQKAASLSASLLEALKAVLISVGKGTTKPELLGVTFASDGKQVHMFTTDDDTIAWKTAKQPADWSDQRVILPTSFVQQLLSFNDPKTKLYLSKDNAIAVTSDDVKLFARIVDCPKPYDFEKIANDNIQKTDPVPVPNRLRLALERASVMLNGQADELMEIAIKDDHLRIYARTPFGDLKDNMTLDKSMPDMNCKLHPERVKRALPFCEKIGFSDRAIVMTGDHFIYMAATVSAS